MEPTEVPSLNADDLIAAILRALRVTLDADLAILLAQGGPDQFVTLAVDSIDQGPVDPRVAVSETFAVLVAQERRPLTTHEVRPAHYPDIGGQKVQALLGVPVFAGERLLGVLQVGHLVERALTEEHTRELQLAAGRLAPAMEAQQAREERTAARLLQRNLLSPRLPVMEGLELAARYLPSERGGLGGDWYDVFRLPNGQVAITIGDAMGHGMEAAVMMTRLRSTLRAYAMESDDPAAVLTRLDQKVQHFEPGELATVLYGIFSASLDHITFSSAGHPRPVLVRPARAAEPVDVPADTPVGISGGRRRSVTISVSPGTMLFCYTDGLIERPRIAMDAQLERLLWLLEPGRPEPLCRSVTTAFLSSDPTADDVAVLAVRRLPDDPPRAD